MIKMSFGRFFLSSVGSCRLARVPGMLTGRRMTSPLKAWSVFQCHDYKQYSPLFKALRSASSWTEAESSDSLLEGPSKKLAGHRRLLRIRRRPQAFVEVDDSSHTSNETPISVAMDMMLADDLEAQSLSSIDEKLEMVRADIDARLKELEELADVQIRSVDVAVEIEKNFEAVDGEDETESDRPLTEMPISRDSSRTLRLFGSPDPSIPASTVPCHGCGSHLHCRDPGIPGYVPSQIYLATTRTQLKDVLCQRCHLLSEFNIAIDISVKPLEYEAIAAEIRRNSPALLLITLDVTDLPNSFYDDFAKLGGKHRPIYIIGNKVDLLPRDGHGYLERVRESIVELCTRHGITPHHVALVSAKTGYGIEDLITHLLRDWRLEGHVYILGCTNAGKSTLFNSLLASDFCRIAARDVIQRATTSIWPGTTLNLLKFPIMNPKPNVLHRRMERLRAEHSQQTDEERLGRKNPKCATLMGHIGVTSATPKEIALEQCLERHKSGFIVPSYEFVTSDGGGETTQEGWLKDNIGKESAIKHLDVKVEKYNDKTFKYWCYDTPGLVNPHQVVNLLSSSELMVLLVNDMITPRSFYFKPSHVMFVSGLGRIDYAKGDVPVTLTVFSASNIPVHVLKSEDSAEFYRANVGTPVLGIPLGDFDRLSSLPSLVGREFTVKGTGTQESAADIILSTLGWVSITADADQEVTLRAFTPGGFGCQLRSPALLKYAVNLHGKRIRGTYAYYTKPPRMFREC